MRLALALILCVALTGCGTIQQLLGLYDDVTCAGEDNSMTGFYDGPFEEGATAVGMAENHDGVPCTAGVTEGADLKCMKMPNWDADTWGAARDALRLPRAQCVKCANDTIICPPWMTRGEQVWPVVDESDWGSIKSLYR